MRYFGIKTPGETSYIWWIAADKHMAWQQFFQYPNKNGDFNPSRAPTYEAIQAYEAIGYKCVELEVKEIRQYQDELAAAQAKIDALMLEYCPNEMTKEQLDEWARNQKPVEEK